MIPRVIGYRHCVVGTRRPIFEGPDGRQFVLDDDARPVYGVYLDLERELCDEPVIVQGQGG